MKRPRTAREARRGLTGRAAVPPDAIPLEALCATCALKGHVAVASFEYIFKTVDAKVDICRKHLHIFRRFAGALRFVK